MKKKLKIFGIILLLFIAILFILPIIFEDDIEELVLKNVNKELKAEISWSDFNLSLLADFPDAQLSIEDLRVINQEEAFAGDTLMSVKNVKAGMPLMNAFSDNISIEYFNLDQASISLITNKNGEVNYLITQESETSESASEDNSSQEPLKFSLKEYAIHNSELHYIDLESQMDIGIKKFEHEGSGDFTTDEFTLKTKSDAMLSFKLDSVSYLSGNHIQLDSDFAVNLTDMKFEFLENELLINKLPLKFDGYYQLGDQADQMDISFATPTSDFKNLLALIPEAYQTQMDEVETSGEFSVDGNVVGKLAENEIPKFNIAMKSEDASFNYPSLPKQAEHIDLDILIKNSTGQIDDTKVIGKKVNFSISGNRLQNTFALSDLTDKLAISFNSKGSMNLADIDQIYPMEEKLDLKGNLSADIQAAFTMDAVEKENYAQVKTLGNLSLTGFNFSNDQLPHPINIKKAAINFTQNYAELSSFSMTTGSSDIQASGKLDNLLGFALQDQELKGDFSLNSQKIIVSDLMSTAVDEQVNENESAEKETASSEDAETLQIPDFLSFQADFKADEVIYDQMKFKNTRGKLSIKNQVARILDFQANTLSGSVTGSAILDTKNKQAAYESHLKLTSISIPESMKEMTTLQKFAPIMNILNGVFSTNIDLSGTLNEDLTPNFDQLQGDILADIQQAGVNPKKMELANRLDNQLGFLNGKDLNLNPLKAKLEIKNGGVNVKPFSFKIDDIGVNLSGHHSFSQNMDYQLKLKVPAKYLGDKAGSQLAKLSDNQLKNMLVDLPVGISGALDQPKINVNMKQAVKNLSNQIIQAQKDKLKDKATDAVNDKIKDLLGGQKDNDEQKNDDNKKDNVEDKAKDLLNGLLGGKKKD